MSGSLQRKNPTSKTEVGFGFVAIMVKLSPIEVRTLRAQLHRERPVMQRNLTSQVSILALASILAGCPSSEDPRNATSSPGTTAAAGASGAASVVPGATAAATASGAAPVGALFTPRPRTFEAKGVYFTATSVEMSSRWKPWLKALKAAGGNMVLFDAKDEDGIVQWQSKVPLSKEMGASKEGPIRDLKAKIKEAHDMGIHVAGRVCCFHDPILAKKHPELAPRVVLLNGDRPAGERPLRLNDPAALEQRERMPHPLFIQPALPREQIQLHRLLHPRRRAGIEGAEQ